MAVAWCGHDRPMRLDGGWHKERWQLVAVDHGSDRIVLDVIELGDVTRGQSCSVATIELRGSTPGDLLVIGERLEGWLHRADGLCEVFRRVSPARGCLAMFQESEAVVVETSPSIPG
jgi:hypothetical protein